MKTVFISTLLILIATSVCIATPPEEPEPAWLFNAERDTRFLLFSRLNPTIGQQLIFRDLTSLRNSNYNGDLPTRVIIHGFQSDDTSDVNVLLTAAYLRNSAVNVIVGELNRFMSQICKML